MKDRPLRWVFLASIVGIAFFVIANFTNFLPGSNFVIGCVQIGINGFVCSASLNAFSKTHGFRRFVAFLGITIPVVVAVITIWRVLIPAFVR